jgi:arylsulfatase A-like enzyme
VLARWAPALAPLRPHDTTAALSRYAAAFLRWHGDRPFYLWVHYIDPHAPYDPPERYRSLRGRWPFFHPYQGGEAWGLPILGDPEWDVPEADRDYVASLYHGEIRYVDEFIGRLRADLARRGLAEHTYLCLTSDHGEELWEHGDWGHGHALYEEQVHVPWILAGPGLPAQRVATPVSAIDLVPTLAGLLGLPADPAWHGESLSPALRAGQAPAARPVFIQGTSNRTPVDPLRMVLAWPFKLVEGATTGRVWLYDLERDPEERGDLALTDPARAEALRARLHQWLATFESTFPAESGALEGNALLEQLQGMGYL